MDSSGHAFLIANDPKFRCRTLNRFLVSSFLFPLCNKNISGGGWEEDENNATSESVKSKRRNHQYSEQLLQQAILIYHKKDSLKKAIDFLIENKFINNTPQEIANFVRVYKNNFDPVAIGDYLGKNTFLSFLFHFLLLFFFFFSPH